MKKCTHQLNSMALSRKRNNSRAGGVATNRNGLAYEKRTMFESIITRLDKVKLRDQKGKLIRKNMGTHVEIGGLKMVYASKSELDNFMCNMRFSSHIFKKKLQPDMSFIDITCKRLYVLEKKYQACSGTVDEKIQTFLFKKWLYTRLYPSFTIHYAYVLNDWFRHDRYAAERQFMLEHGIDIFWGDHPSECTDRLLTWLTRD